MLFTQFILAAALAAPAFARSRTLKPRATCNSGVYVLRGRGTDEKPTGNRLEIISSAIVQAIPDSFAEEIEYPASLDLINSITVGVTFLTQRLTDYAQQCPGRDVVLLGYSQGAVVTGITLVGTNFSNTNVSPIDTKIGESVAALVHFGDPTEVPGQGTNALGDLGCKVAGPLARKGQYFTNMDVYADRLLDYCDADDGICCGTGGDPIAHISYFGQNTTDTVVKFVVEQHAKRGGSSGGASPSQTTAAPSTRPTASAHTSASASSSAVAPPSPTKSESASATTTPPSQYTGAADELHMSTFVMLGAGLIAALANL